MNTMIEKAKSTHNLAEHEILELLKNESIIGLVLDKKVDLIKATKIYHNLLRMQG